MTAFEREVFRALKPLAAYGFVSAQGVGDKDHAFVLAPAACGLVVYVYVRRTWDEMASPTLTATAWVAPPHFPDDSLDALGVGYNILLARSDSVSDFFGLVVRRAVGVLSCRRMCELVIDELAAPHEVSRRLQLYLQERPLAVWLLETAAQDADVAHLMAEGRRFIRAGRYSLYAEAIVSLVSLLRERFRGAHELAFLGEMVEEGLGEMMLERALFVDLLLDSPLHPRNTP